tara:strand:- start:261 stop:683 length:423 start_codon:yes stop_codon:yes gene_type:complete
LGRPRAVHGIPRAVHAGFLECAFSRLRFTAVRFKSFVPLPQLFVPAFFDLQAQMRLSVHQDAHRRLGELQLVVDGDDRLDAPGGVGHKLRLFVVQRLGVRTAPLGDHAEGPDVNRQRFFVVLAKLREVQQSCDNLRRDRG